MCLGVSNKNVLLDRTSLINETFTINYKGKKNHISPKVMILFFNEKKILATFPGSHLQWLA